jgi:hypothetical protein
VAYDPDGRRTPQRAVASQRPDSQLFRRPDLAQLLTRPPFISASPFVIQGMCRTRSAYLDAMKSGDGAGVGVPVHPGTPDTPIAACAAVTSCA